MKLKNCYFKEATVLFIQNCGIRTYWRNKMTDAMRKEGGIIMISWWFCLPNFFFSDQISGYYGNEEADRQTGPEFKNKTQTQTWLIDSSGEAHLLAISVRRTVDVLS